MTTHTLEKLEQLLSKLGYKVRYEKGNFKSGSCILEAHKVIVINKFSNLDAKIAAMIQLVQQSTVEEGLLEDKQKQYYQALQQIKLF